MYNKFVKRLELYIVMKCKLSNEIGFGDNKFLKQNQIEMQFANNMYEKTNKSKTKYLLIQRQ